MVGKNTYFKAEDFNQRGIFNQFHSECEFDNVAFKKSHTFKHQDIQQVLDICKKHNGLGINTLIVKDETNLTIWIEYVSQSQATARNNSSEAASKNSSADIQAALPTKTVTKRYRGQVYEETVVDWAAVAMQQQGIKTNNTTRRKYRGNYID